MAIREGRWDCPSCGSRGQLGRNLECTGCGAPRPEGIRFYLPGDEPPVTDAARLAQARAGADWVCEHCGGSARATETGCPGCGAARGSSAARPVLDLSTAEVRHSSDDAEAAQDADRAAERARNAAAAAGASAGPADGAKKNPGPATAKDWLIAGCTGCGGLGCLGLILLFLVGMCTGPAKEKTDGPAPAARPAVSARPDSGAVEHFDPFMRVIVLDRRWTRSVSVEALRQVVARGQDPPGDAEILGSSREVVDHRRVFDHNESSTRRYSERVRTGSEEYVCGQRDLGNGYFEDRMCSRPVYETQTRTESESEPVYRDEPVYGTVYRYQVWRWLNDTTLTAVSHDLAPPRWPAVGTRRTRRAGERTERREVEVRAAGGPARYTVEVDTLVYRRLLVGDTVRAVMEDGVMRRILPIWRGREASARLDSLAASAARDTARTSAGQPRRSTSRPRRSTTRPRRTSSGRSSSRGR